MVFRFNLFALSGFCLDWSVYFFTFFWQRGFRNVQNDLIEEGRVEEQRDFYSKNVSICFLLKFEQEKFKAYKQYCCNAPHILGQ